MFDCHIHSIHSFDSEQTLDDLCQEAIEKGVQGIAITDHAYLSKLHEHDVINCINELVLDVCSTKEKYKGKLKVFSGVEVSEVVEYQSLYEQLLISHEFDVVLGSIHIVSGDTMGYAKIDFGLNNSNEYLFDYLHRYFNDVDQLLDVASFDVLAHLTCPLRYVIGRYKNNVSLKEFEEQIVEILRKLISKNIALEVNSSGYSDGSGYHPLPDADILKLYYDMGGRLLTLGSDCHRNRRIAHDFDKVIEILKNIGFEYYCYYEKRKPVRVYI